MCFGVNSMAQLTHKTSNLRSGSHTFAARQDIAIRVGIGVGDSLLYIIHHLWRFSIGGKANELSITDTLQPGQVGCRGRE